MVELLTYSKKLTETNLVYEWYVKSILTTL